MVSNDVRCSSPSGTCLIRLNDRSSTLGEAIGQKTATLDRVGNSLEVGALFQRIPDCLELIVV